MGIGLAHVGLAVWIAACGPTPTPNLLTNGDMEAPVGRDGQPPGMRVCPVDSRTKASGSFRIVTDVHSGRRALQITRSNTDRGYALYLQIPTFEPASPPRRFVVVGWVKTLGGRRRGNAPHLEYQAFTPEWVGACRLVRMTERSPYAGGWGKLAILLEQTRGTTLKCFRFLVEAARPGDGVIVDDLAFYDVTSWASADVEAVMRPGQQPESRVAVDTQPARQGNLIENSSFELGLSRGWSLLGLLPEAQRQAVDRTVSRHGRASVRLDYAARGRSTLAGKFRTVRVHQTHTLSAWVRAEKPGATVTLRFESGYVPRGGVPHHHQTIKKLTPGQWLRVVASGVTQPGPENAYAIRIAATGPDSGCVWVDAVQFEQGPLSDYRPRQTVEAALQPVDPAGISGWVEPVRYVIRVANDGDSDARLGLRTETTDFWQRPVHQASVGLRAFPAGVTTIERSCKPPARGSLRVRLWVVGRAAPEDEITLTVVPPQRHPGRHPQSRFGQHVRLEPWQLGVAKRLGACWVRLHDVERCLSWDGVEPKPGRWVWADDKIGFAHEAGLEVLGVLGRAPAWAAGDEQGRQPSRGGWYYPADLGAWSKYVETVTRHYRGRVDVWEIWNEPWLANFGIGDGTKYAALARAAFRAAKRGNPDCTIIGMCTHEGMVQFNRAAIKGGAMKHCDLVSYHTYTSTGTDAYGRGRLLRDMLGLDRTNKGVWMTEGLGGYTYTWHSLLIDAVDDPYSRRPLAPKFTSERAACTGAVALAGTLATGAEKAFWYWSPWEGAGSLRPDRYTWFEYDGQLKPYAAAYAVSAHFLDGTRSVARRMSRDHLVACVFERDGQAVAVLRWQGEGGTRLALPSRRASKDALLTVFDMMGNPRTPVDGSIEVTSDPIYVQADGSRGTDLISRLGL